MNLKASAFDDRTQEGSPSEKESQRVVRACLKSMLRKFRRRMGKACVESDPCVRISAFSKPRRIDL